MPEPRLILVTGAPRSGTTVVGELLTAASHTGELYEPMNASVGDPAIRNPFEVPGSADFSHEAGEAFIDRVAARRLRPRKASGTKRHPYFNRTNRTIVLDRLSPTRRRTVWKDPFAFFLTPQVVARGDIPVVVTLRDPLSLAGSFKRMDWAADVGGLARRMREAGLRVDETPETIAMTQADPVRTAAVLWNLCHRTLIGWLDQGLDVLPVTVSDLIERPAETSARLAAHTSLRVRPPAAPESQGAQAGANAALPGKAHVKNRSATSITEYWKRVLDEDEAAFCRELCGSLWEELEARLRRQSA